MRIIVCKLGGAFSLRKFDAFSADPADVEIRPSENYHRVSLRAERKRALLPRDPCREAHARDHERRRNHLASLCNRSLLLQPQADQEAAGKCTYHLYIYS